MSEFVGGLCSLLRRLSGLARDSIYGYHVSIDFMHDGCSARGGAIVCSNNLLKRSGNVLTLIS
jgi:hypothetical protein